MLTVARSRPYVVGADTHARSHALALVAAGTGELVTSGQFPSSPAGMARAIAWVGKQTGGLSDVLWAIEGIGSYGARLASGVSDVGYEVVEAGRMSAGSGRGLGKSDPLDAQRIAASVL